MATIYPSLMASDTADLAKTITLLDPLCHGYHIDVMDNVFVPNITFSIDTVHAIAARATRPLWVHLMVQKPADWIAKMNISGGSTVTFHFESEGEHKELIKSIREKNWRAGMAINPKTTVDKIFPIVDQLDQILIMSVEPGFAGQPFLTETLAKIDPLVGYRQTKGLAFRIAMDGGINETNLKELVAKKVDDLVVGSALFNKKDLVRTMQFLNDLAKIAE